MSITGKIVSGLVRRRVSEPDGVEPVQVEVLGIIESRRIAEPIGDDPPVQCDNRRSPSEKTFTLRASRTWRREYIIQAENMRTESSSTAVGLDKEIAAKVEHMAQQTMRESYSRTDELQETFEASVSVTVPAGELELVTLAWKRIWQLGYVKMRVDGIPVEVPFKKQVGVNFDMK
jgi:hypothetical protein